MTDNDTHEEIDAMALAAMKGHGEARERLRKAGWTEDQIDDLQRYSAGHYDFARSVASVIIWERNRDDDQEVRTDGGRNEDTRTYQCEHCGSEGEAKTVDYYGNDALACRDCGALL